MSSSTALADHIGVYSDNTGSSCQLGPAGQFNSGATVIHKFAAGATGSWFDIELPAATSFFSFSSPFSPIPNVTTDGIALDYRHLSLIHISEPTRLLSISYAVFCLK